MSAFEFHCTKCGNIFGELFKNSNDRFEIRCPECKDENIVQTISSSNYLIAGGLTQKQPQHSYSQTELKSNFYKQILLKE